jgi:RNA polymerase sigma-70 factor (ECF subfamily)
MQEFDAIYRAYHEDIYRFLLKLTLYNADLAEELTQETFFHAYLAIGRFEGRCHIRTWLCQIAKNRFSMWLRKKGQETALAEAPELRSMEAVYDEKRQVARLLKAIQTLDEPGREIVLYRVFSDLPYTQIAGLLGISENSARVIYYRCKKSMQDKMREEFQDEI